MVADDHHKAADSFLCILYLEYHSTAIMNNKGELVPWGVVFIVLSAVMFCSSSLTTFFSTMKKKSLAKSFELVQEDSMDASESPHVSSEPRILDMMEETVRPVDFTYSGAKLTR